MSELNLFKSQNYNDTYRQHGEMQTEVAPAIIEAVKFFKEKGITDILDLGCGTGRNSIFLMENGFNVKGCDISIEALKMTKKKQEEFSGVVCTMNQLSFENNSIEGIICNHVLQHGVIKDIKTSISEIHRILKTGGILLLEVASTQSSKFLKGEEIEPGTKINVGGYDGHVPHHFFTKEELKLFFKDFKILSIEHSIHPSELNPEIMSATWKMYAEK